MVVLAGAPPNGAYFAVCRFLQKFGGVNWYFPGDWGEHIPLRQDWAVPLGWWTEAPAYVSREFTGLRAGAEQQWARRNLLAGHFSFSHNLAKVFDAGLFGEHPDFFPWRNGARQRPSGPDDLSWQPDFSNPTVAAYAAEQVKRAFPDPGPRPIFATFSLGLNDNTGFDEGPGTLALTQPRKWFRRRPDYSNLVFTFMNRVADDLGPAYKDVSLGCLAYFWCENTPSFPVRPQVLPYLTNDRSFYTDRAWAAEDLALIKRWAKAGPNIIGIYDYYYGGAFQTPRIFTTAMVDSIREAREAGARAFVAELYPHWEYDALKAWLAAQLLWDPAADAAALEAQFYRDLYGPAAGDVRDFFHEAEAAWRDQPGPPQWLKGYKDPYEPTIFSLSRVRAMSAALTRANARQVDAPTQARLALLTKAWTDSAWAIKTAWAERELAGNPAATSWDIAAGLKASAAATVDGAAGGFFLRAADWASQHGEEEWLEGTLSSVALHDKAPNRFGAENLFSPRGQNLLKNGELSAIAGQGPTGWSFTWREAENLQFGASKDGGFRIADSDRTVLWQDIPVAAGGLYEASFEWQGRITYGDRVYWTVAYLDAGGGLLETPWQSTAPPGWQAEWLRDGSVTQAPSGAATLRLSLYVRKEMPGDWVRFSTVQVRAVTPADRQLGSIARKDLVISSSAVGLAHREHP